MKLETLNKIKEFALHCGSECFGEVSTISNDKLEFVCTNCKNKYKSTYNNFKKQKNKFCTNCVHLFRKIKTLDSIKKYCLDNNTTCVTNIEEFDIHNKLKFLCTNCGSYYYMRFYELKRQKLKICSECSGHNILTYKKILKRYTDKNFILNTTEEDFINNNMNSSSKFNITCINGHTYDQIHNSFTNGSGCLICFQLNNTGENHPSWNPDKSEYNKFCNPIINSLKTIKRLKSANYLRLTEQLLGYTKEEYDNNIGEYDSSIYDLDHIFPKKAFFEFGLTDVKYIKIINHFDNLEILPKLINYSKSDKYDDYKFLDFLIEHDINISKLNCKNKNKQTIINEYILNIKNVL